MNKKLIPFRFLPGSWGLVGKVYDEAEAHYRLTGEDLERRLVDINFTGISHAEKYLELDLKYNKISPYEHDIKILELYEKNKITDKAKIDLKHKKISEYEFDKIEAKENNEGILQDHALLDVEFKHGKLSKNEYEKQKANLDNKPWIGIVGQGMDFEQGVNGVYFEFDWNSYWIDYLRLNGYTGLLEEEIVEQWFQDVCKANAEAENLNEDIDSFPIAGRMTNLRKKTNRFRGDDGTFYT